MAFTGLAKVFHLPSSTTTSFLSVDVSGLLGPYRGQELARYLLKEGCVSNLSVERNSRAEYNIGFDLDEVVMTMTLNAISYRIGGTFSCYSPTSINVMWKARFSIDTSDIATFSEPEIVFEYYDALCSYFGSSSAIASTTDFKYAVKDLLANEFYAHFKAVLEHIFTKGESSKTAVEVVETAWSVLD